MFILLSALLKCALALGQWDTIYHSQELFFLKSSEVWDNGTQSIKAKSFYFLKSSEVWDNGTQFVKGQDRNEMNAQLVWNCLTHLIEMHNGYKFVFSFTCCLAVGQWDTFYQTHGLLFPEKFGSLGQWDTLCQRQGNKWNECLASLELSDISHRDA